MTRHSTSSSSSDLEAHHSSSSYPRRPIDKSYKQHFSRNKGRKVDTNSDDSGSRSDNGSEGSSGSSSDEGADSKPLARTGGAHARDSIAKSKKTQQSKESRRRHLTWILVDIGIFATFISGIGVFVYWKHSTTTNNPGNVSSISSPSTGIGGDSTAPSAPVASSDISYALPPAQSFQSASSSPSLPPSTLNPSNSSSIIVYPPPPLPSSTVFTLKASNQVIYVPMCATYHTAAFSAPPSRLIAIVVTFLPGTITRFSLEPKSALSGLLSPGSLSGNSLSFTVQAPAKVEIRINTAVTLFSDTPATTSLYLSVDLPEVPSEIPSASDTTGLFFGPGTHELGLKTFDGAGSKAPKWIYVAPGALVNAAWHFSHTTNLVISGRGYIKHTSSQPMLTSWYFMGCSNITIKDVYIIDSPQHVMQLSSGSHTENWCFDFLIDNIKSFHRMTYQRTADGITYFGPTHNILFQNSFWVNNDNIILFQASLPTGPFNNTFRSSVFLKPADSGNFFFPQSAPSNGAYSQLDVTTGTFGSGNLFTDLDVIRTSGEIGFICYDGVNSFPNMVLDNIRVGNFASRAGTNKANHLLELGGPGGNYKKEVTIQNSAFPLGFSGSNIGSGWVVNLVNVTLGGKKVTGDADIGAGIKGSGSVVNYS